MALEAGEKYLVTWRNGQKHVGEVVEKRLAKSNPEGGGSGSSSKSTSSSKKENSNLNKEKNFNITYIIHTLIADWMNGLR